MAETFKVGEIALLIRSEIQGDVCWPEYLGQDVEVIGPLIERSCWDNRARTRSILVACYRIRASDGKIFCALPENLRKKRLPPPREELGEWDLCPWKPALPVTVTGDV